MLGDPLVRYAASLEPLEIWFLSQPGSMQDDSLVWAGQGLLDDETFTDAPAYDMDQVTPSTRAYLPPDACDRAKDILSATLKASDGRMYTITSVQEGKHFRHGVRVFWFVRVQAQDRTGHGEAWKELL